MRVSEKNWTISVIRPEELDLVTNVFRKIVAEPWFVKDIRQRQKFGALVIHIYQGGTKNECDLYAACYQIAKERFNAPGQLH